jgi:hypothetical protein
MKLIRTASIFTILLLSPVTFSRADGLQGNDACAMGQDCCVEAGSTCVIDGVAKNDHYYSTKGCKTVTEQ